MFAGFDYSRSKNNSAHWVTFLIGDDLIRLACGQPPSPKGDLEKLSLTANLTSENPVKTRVLEYADAVETGFFEVA